MKKKIFNFSSHVRTIACNQEFIAVGLRDGTINLYNGKIGNLVQSWKKCQDGISALVFLSDGGLVSGTWGGTVKKWDLNTRGNDEKSTPKELWSRSLGGFWTNALTEIPGKNMVAVCLNNVVCVLDLSTGQELLQGGLCKGHDGSVYAVISLGEIGAGSFASGATDGTIRVWDFPNLSETKSLITLRQIVQVGRSVGRSVYSLALSPLTQLSCGRKVVMVAAGCVDGSVHLFRLPDWNVVWQDDNDDNWSVTHGDSVRSLSFSPDGRFLASASDDCLIKIIFSETGIILRTLKGHTDWVMSVLFSQDGFSVLSGSRDKTVRVWRLVEQDDRIASLLGGCSHSDLVYQSGEVFKQLFTIIRTKLIRF